MYYIKETEPGLFTVGCDVQGIWMPYKDCNQQEAEDLCAKLNGNQEMTTSMSQVDRAFQIFLALITANPTTPLSELIDTTWNYLGAFDSSFHVIQKGD